MAGSGPTTASTVPNQASLPVRDVTLDIARGVAIIAVVIGHALRGLLAAGLADPSATWVAFLDMALYLMHLPVFAFATGLLMAKPVQRDGAAHYLRMRLAMLAYVFLLWTLIQGAIEVWTSPVKNVPVTWGDVATVWRPLGQLWFLPLLMLATVLVVVVAPWRGGTTRLLALATVVLGGVGCWGLEGEWIFTRGLALMPFFMLGAVVTQERFSRGLKRCSGAWLAVIGFVTCAIWLATAANPWVTAPTVLDPERSPISVGVGLVGSVAAVTAVGAVSGLLARSQRAGAWLAYAGRLSLHVYLVHIIFTAGVRVVLTRAGVMEPGLHLVAGAIAGVAGPLLVERVTRRWPWLFVPPWTLEREARTPARLR